MPELFLDRSSMPAAGAASAEPAWRLVARKGWPVRFSIRTYQCETSRRRAVGTTDCADRQRQGGYGDCDRAGDRRRWQFLAHPTLTRGRLLVTWARFIEHRP